MRSSVVSVNGEDLFVEKHNIELTEEPVEVYNFNVDDAHTYFVSENAVWVHNAEGCGIQENGHVDAEKIAENPSEFTGKDIDDYACEIETAGYEFEIKKIYSFT